MSDDRRASPRFRPGDRVRLQTTTGPVDGTVGEPPEDAPGYLVWVRWDDDGGDSWAYQEALEKTE